MACVRLSPRSKSGNTGGSILPRGENKVKAKKNVKEMGLLSLGPSRLGYASLIRRGKITTL